MADKYIKVKATGVETKVSQEYFDKYSNDGWFIEIPAPKEEAPKKAPAKAKADTKEE